MIFILRSCAFDGEDFANVGYLKLVADQFSQFERTAIHAVYDLSESRGDTIYSFTEFVGGNVVAFADVGHSEPDSNLRLRFHALVYHWKC
jgi:hypothetical protein